MPERIAVVGGGIGGLGAALALGRAGHQVTLVERDDLTGWRDPEASFAAERRGAPQVRHTHGFLARLTGVLRERFPDVLEDLRAAGAYEIPLAARLGDPQPGDDELSVLIARRTTVEWAFRRAVEAEPSIERRGGVPVTGLVGERASGDEHGPVPLVTGVRLDGGEVIEAPTTIAACGRRADVPGWLAELGVTIGEQCRDTGIVYLTRWYRHRPGWVPGSDAKLAGDLGHVKYLVIPGDGATVSATLAIPAHDRELRSTLLRPAAFDRAVALLQGPDRVMAEGVEEALGPVLPMAGLVNRLRRFTSPSGQALVGGFHAIGDAHTCTNPFYGRGCSIALLQAALLADAFAEHPADPLARAAVYEAACAAATEPWYRLAVATDTAARAMSKRRRSSGRAAGGDAGAPGGQPAGTGAGQLAIAMRAVILGGATDPVIGRGVLRVMNMLTTPGELFADPEFMTRVQAIVADPAALAAAANLPGPSRDELLATAA